MSLCICFPLNYMVVAYNSLLSYPNFYKWQDKESSLKTMNLAGFNDFRLILIETIPLTLPTARKLPRIMNKVVSITIRILDWLHRERVFQKIYTLIIQLPYLKINSFRTCHFYKLWLGVNLIVSLLNWTNWAYQKCTFSLEQIVEGFILNKNCIKEYWMNIWRND